MNHASGAVASEDAEVVQVGDAIWQRAQRRGLVQGAVPVLLWGSGCAGPVDSRVSAAQRLMLRR